MGRRDTRAAQRVRRVVAHAVRHECEAERRPMTGAEIAGFKAALDRGSLAVFGLVKLAALDLDADGLGAGGW